MELLYLILTLFFLMSLSFFFSSHHLRPREASPRRRARRLKRKDNTKKTRKTDSQKRIEQGNSRDIDHIYVGDIIEVTHLNKDFLVEEHYQMKESSWHWDEYTLVDGDDEYVLSVADQGKEIYLSHKIEDLALSYPPPETTTYKGDTYTLVDSGQAKAQKKGEKESHRLRYFTYESADEFTLMLEDEEGEIEYFLGEKLHPRDIEILPGSNNT